MSFEDENGALARGRDEVKDVLDAWARSHTGIPEVGERARQAFNIVLSMPPGTSRPGVRAAAKTFAAAEFGLNHQYVFTAHDDEAHPHVHLVVKAVGRDGVRLNPRKADLQRWRELFAGALHEQGIVANATPRRARGIGSRAPAQRLLHMRVRGPNARAPTSSPRAPLLSPVVARAYRSTQQALAASSEVADQRLARELERFLAETSPTVERERKPDGPTRER